MTGPQEHLRAENRGLVEEMAALRRLWSEDRRALDAAESDNQRLRDGVEHCITVAQTGGIPLHEAWVYAPDLRALLDPPRHHDEFANAINDPADEHPAEDET